MSNNTLPAEVQEQIKIEADKYVVHTCYQHEMSIGRYSFEAGATEYALKLEQAKQLLEKFIARHEAGLLPDVHIYNEIKSFLDGK